MLVLALVLAGGVVVAPSSSVTAKRASASAAPVTTSLHAGLVVAAAGSSMFWMRRVSTDARTPGHEAEAVRMLDAARPVGAVAAFVALSVRGVVDVE